jgi:Protein of unknown function (DUF4242)
VPRYIVERTWDDLDEEAMDQAGARSKRIAQERYPEITWEHSHVVVDRDGVVRTFCVYGAPGEDVVIEHSKRLGAHDIEGIHEIAGDVTPADFPPEPN